MSVSTLQKHVSSPSGYDYRQQRISSPSSFSSDVQTPQNMRKAEDGSGFDLSPCRAMRYSFVPSATNSQRERHQIDAVVSPRLSAYWFWHSVGVISTFAVPKANRIVTTAPKLLQTWNDAR